MLGTLLLAVAEAGEEESSKTLFYVAGLLLTVFALVISAVGIRGHETFPGSPGRARAVMGLAALLVGFTLVSAVATG